MVGSVQGVLWALCKPLFLWGQGHRRQLHYNCCVPRSRGWPRPGLALLLPLPGAFHFSFPSLPCTQCGPLYFWLCWISHSSAPSLAPFCWDVASPGRSFPDQPACVLIGVGPLGFLRGSECFHGAVPTSCPCVGLLAPATSLHFYGTFARYILALALQMLVQSGS